MLINKPLLLLIILAVMGIPMSGKHLHTEKHYQDKHCKRIQGITEYSVGGVRVDCLTEEYAIEYDFANKFYEGISQALYYSQLTGKKPMLVLIQEKPYDKKYIRRAEAIIRVHKLKVILEIITPKTIREINKTNLNKTQSLNFLVSVEY